EHFRASVDIEPPVVSVDSGGAADLGLSFDVACADEAHARCARLAACSTALPTLMTRLWGDQPTCEARLKLDCLLEAGAPGSGLTTDLVERRAAAWTTELCADRFADFRPLPCLVPGTRDTGAGCFYDSQCKSGFCQLLVDHGCGTCSDATTAGVSSCTG